MTKTLLRCSDCLDFLKSVESNSIDYINVDPPYNIGYDGGSGWDKFDSEDDYLNWCKQWVVECARIIKPGRMVSIWGTTKSDTFLRLKLDIINCIHGMYSQNAIHWSYNWGGRPKNNFAHKFETAWCVSKGKDFLFNDCDAIRVPRKMKTNIRTGLPYSNGTIPTTIWEGNLSTCSNEARDSSFHPTVKPQFVLQRMICAYSHPGETVLDCFSGSGSTALACIHTERNFIGCEKNADYYSASLSRLRKYSNLTNEIVCH